MHAGDGTGWWMLWGGIMMVLFWGAIIGLIVWGVQPVTRRDHRHHEGSFGRSATPIDIAKERYARGEIDREQFERITADLERPSAGEHPRVRTPVPHT